MEANVIKCPNCGASSSNHTNCEYCGSLLVRFVDKGIDLHGTSYLDNSFVFPGLIEALKKNLEYQKERRGSVETSILFHDKLGYNIGYYDGFHICVDGDDLKEGIEPYLSVGYDFVDVLNPSGDETKKIKDLMITRLSLLKSFPLFEKDETTDEDGFLYRSYYLDMGQDAEGAARLISELMIKVQEVSMTEPVFIFTYYEDDEDSYNSYRKAFVDWCRKNGLPIEDNIEGENEVETDENYEDNKDSSSLWDRIVSIFK